MEKNQKSSTNDSLPLGEMVRLFGDIAVEIESGAEVDLHINSDFLYEVADALESCEKDEIHIDCGDEVVVIDGDLATRTIRIAVEQYINKVLLSYINKQDSSDELIEWQEAYYALKQDYDRLKENNNGNQ